jgi:N-acetylglucosamine-6-phosphate deacetylase
MSDGEVCARHYATGRPACVRWRNGVITHVAPAADDAAGERWMAPALVDLQVNGFAGVDFQRDDVTETALRHAGRGLAAAGCGLFLLTLITDEWPRLLARLRHLRNLRAQSAELQTALVGWHLEGPFLSAEPGYQGAHDPGCMCDPTPAHVEEVRQAAGNDPVLLTLAPERPGALATIERAVALGITISLGHTNATAEVLRAAVAAGATGFTHLGNACPQQLDRHDNILWRVFDTPGLTVSLIPDRIHVSPLLFRLAHRVCPPDALYYVTDAMAAAGAPPGRFTIGQLEVEVGADQIVRQPGRSNYAGSALGPFDGVCRAAEMLGCAWPQAWARFSTVPAKFMGLRHDLAAGQPARFCLLDARPGAPPRLVETVTPTGRFKAGSG